MLALLSTGELYLCDTRKSHRTRAELLESILEDGEEEDENSGQGRARYVSFHLCVCGCQLIV